MASADWTSYHGLRTWTDRLKSYRSNQLKKEALWFRRYTGGFKYIFQISNPVSLNQLFSQYDSGLVSLIISVTVEGVNLLPLHSPSETQPFTALWLHSHKSQRNAKHSSLTTFV